MGFTDDCFTDGRVPSVIPSVWFSPMDFIAVTDGMSPSVKLDNVVVFSFHIMWFCHVEELHGSKCIRLTHHGRSVDGCFTLTSWYGFDITRDHYCIPFNGGLMDEKEGWIEKNERVSMRMSLWLCMRMSMCMWSCMPCGCHHLLENEWEKEGSLLW
jgi:hypothetical protein